MQRRPFPILSTLSLTLCVAVAVMWLRGYFVTETYAWYADRAAIPRLAATAAAG